MIFFLRGTRPEKKEREKTKEKKKKKKEEWKHIKQF